MTLTRVRALFVFSPCAERAVVCRHLPDLPDRRHACPNVGAAFGSISIRLLCDHCVFSEVTGHGVWNLACFSVLLRCRSARCQL
jgi:hypothetical protein